MICSRLISHALSRERILSMALKSCVSTEILAPSKTCCSTIAWYLAPKWDNQTLRKAYFSTIQDAGDTVTGPDTGVSKAYSANVKIEVPYTQVIQKPRTHWTREMDEALKAGVSIHKEDGWAKVAEHVGYGLTTAQCYHRWRTFRHIAQNVMRTGSFTAQEDGLIRQRVAEWGDNDLDGLWASLEHEIARSAIDVEKRWTDDLKQLEIALTRTTNSAIQQERRQKYFSRRILRQEWSPATDALLTEGVVLHKESGGWKRVAEHVGGGVSAAQCAGRWNICIGPAQQEGIKRGNWSDEEVQQLEKLVPQHVIKPHWSVENKRMTQERTDWSAICKAMNRIPSECTNKWHRLQNSRMKQGPFTAEEDALIVKRVAEWGEKGRGMWLNLQQELGRPLVIIWQRWIRTLRPENALPAHKIGSIVLPGTSPLLHGRNEQCKWTKWTAAMDALLTEGVALYKESGGWKRVAELVGGGVTVQQCKGRWHSYLGKVQQEGIKLGNWSAEEVKQLEELVSQHVIKPYWSETYKAMTQECTDWAAIGKIMKRIPHECYTKWKCLQASKMKQGRFTPEEDALIRRRVNEWGDKGNGLWVSLQQELGRPAKRILARWKRIK